MINLFIRMLMDGARLGRTGLVSVWVEILHPLHADGWNFKLFLTFLLFTKLGWYRFI